MPSNLITVHGLGGTRLVRQLVGLLDHRQVAVTSLHASVEGESCTVRLAFDAADDAAVELLTKRINRLVGVVAAIRLDDECDYQRNVGIMTVQVADPAPAMSA